MHVSVKVSNMYQESRVDTSTYCHSCGSRNLDVEEILSRYFWFPASAGMTKGWENG